MYAIVLGFSFKASSHFMVQTGLKSHYIAQADLKLVVLLSQSPDCWDYCHVPAPQPLFFSIRCSPVVSTSLHCDKVLRKFN